MKSTADQVREVLMNTPWQTAREVAELVDGVKVSTVASMLSQWDKAGHAQAVVPPGEKVRRYALPHDDVPVAWRPSVSKVIESIVDTADLDRQVEELTGQVAELREQLATSKADEQAARLEAEQCRTEAAEVQRVLDVRTAELGRKVERNGELHGRLMTLEADHEKATTLLETETARANVYRGEVARLEGRLKARRCWDNSGEDLTPQLEEARAVIRQRDERIEHLNARQDHVADDLRRKNATLERALAAASDRRNEALAEATALRRELARVRKRQESTEAALEATGAAVHVLTRCSR